MERIEIGRWLAERSLDPSPGTGYTRAVFRPFGKYQCHIRNTVKSNENGGKFGAVLQNNYWNAIQPEDFLVLSF